MGILSSIWNIYQGIKQNKEANEIHPQYDPYTSSQYAASTLGTAQQLFGGRMAGATAEEQNIYGNTANTDAAITKTAGDSSQALALESATQAQAGKQFTGLGIQEDQNKYQLLNNLNLSNQGMTTEGDKVYQANLQKYMFDMQRQAALRGAGSKNIGSGIGGVESAATFGIDSNGGGGSGIAGGIISSII
jgi:hypothetical protein